MLIPVERIENSILLIRGQKLILDRDLASLYGVPLKALNQAVKRNRDRFPEDFMFELSAKETEVRWNYVTSNRSCGCRKRSHPMNRTATTSAKPFGFRVLKGVDFNRCHFGDNLLKGVKNIKYRPFAFTEHRILMLSTVLKSERAIQANIAVMRTFIRVQELLVSNADLNRRLNALERKCDEQFKVVFDAIRQILMPPEKSKRPMGFQVRERTLRYAARKRN